MSKHLTRPLLNSLPPAVGSSFPERVLTTFDDLLVKLPDPENFVHLQLRRFAGCPICNLHLRSFSQRSEELVQARVREVAVFHSTADELRKVYTQLPFAVIADPQKILYAELGIGTSPRALLHPRAMGAVARALLSGAATHPTAGAGDGSWGLPGDFFIAPSGTILALYRGTHADDHWSVEHVLELSQKHQSELP